MSLLRRWGRELNENVGLYLLIFLLVFLKKWEPGGHIDATWYSTIGKNIAETGNYFHFFISPHFYPEIFDHFPLSYWVMGKFMDWFGPTDLAARFYFMICSAVSYFFVFKIGEEIKDKAYGYGAVLLLATCFYFGKWSGGIKHDVPLTMAYLGFIFFFLKGLKDSRFFYGCSFFIAWGVFSKGPVMMGAPLGLFGWLLVSRQWNFFKQIHFWGSLALMFLFLALPFLPALHFKGKNYYSLYYSYKASYLEGESDGGESFLYFVSLVKNQIHVFFFFLASLYLYWFRKNTMDSKMRTLLTLCLFVVFAVLVPFSFFKVKFQYYILPAYPFYALFSSLSLYKIWQRYQWSWSPWLARISIVVMMVMLAFPLKTTGGRPKFNLNLINILKFDAEIKNKDVGFWGEYLTDMSIFQEYKFYGNIDLIPLEKPNKVETFLEASKGYLVTPVERLPFSLAQREWTQQDCFLINAKYCVISLEGRPQIAPPSDKWPQEIYP